MKAVTIDMLLQVQSKVAENFDATVCRHCMQALFKKYFPWLPDRKIAEYTGMKSKSGTGVRRNIDNVERNLEYQKLINMIIKQLE